MIARDSATHENRPWEPQKPNLLLLSQHGVSPRIWLRHLPNPARWFRNADKQDQIFPNKGSTHILLTLNEFDPLEAGAAAPGRLWGLAKPMII